MKTLTPTFTKISHTLTLSLGFALLLLLARIKITHSFFYTFLVWNLILAAVPYIITQILKLWVASPKFNIALILSFPVWLLFLPNSPYIITDLVHLHNDHSHLVWLDLFLVFVFALNGLLLGLLSLLDMFIIIEKRLGKKMAVILIFISCFLSGYGIYLGRFLRFNSWDVFANPAELFQKISSSLLQPQVWLMTLAFGGFLWILFLLMNSLTHRISVRE